MTVQKFDDKYVSAQAILDAGGVWDENGAVYVFGDGSFGRFTDIRNGAAEQTRTGESILHFVAGDGVIE